jgi:splicing factor 3B subunit 4
MNGQYLMNKEISVQYAYKKDGKGERHGDEAERMLSAQARIHNVQLPVQPLPPQLFAQQPVASPQMNGDGRGMPGGIPGGMNGPPGFAGPPSGFQNNHQQQHRPPPSPNPLPPPPSGLPARPPPSVAGYGGPAGFAPPGFGPPPPGAAFSPVGPPQMQGAPMTFPPGFGPPGGPGMPGQPPQLPPGFQPGYGR